MIIDLLTLVLILSIVLIPYSVIRIILGLPFLLFFPGYVLVAALFVRREEMDGIERIALSAGMSVAVTALIGFGLNYTSWGIRLLPVLYSVAAFIVIMSVVAMVRQTRQNPPFHWITEYTLPNIGWEGNRFNKTLTIILVASILITAGVLIYTVAHPRVGERFTEFYILGLSGKASNYPTEFTMNGSRANSVRYGENQIVLSEYGKVKLGIVNDEQQNTTYSLKIQIDGQPVKIYFSDGTYVEDVDSISLQKGDKWEEEIGFAPIHPGANQKVEFLLFKDGDSEVYQSLHLWINVTRE